MALTKRTYSDGNTVITAKNLNEIQDEVIANGNGKVSKSGDTMTGHLNVNNHNIQIANTKYGYDNLPPSAQIMYLLFKEKTDVTIGTVSTELDPDGAVVIRMRARAKVNNANVDNALALYVDADGTRKVGMTSVVPWHKALGLGTDGVLPITIAQGGTGMTGYNATNTISQIITASSGFSITDAQYIQWGKVAQIYVSIKKTAAVTTATTMTMGTLVTGKRPARTSMAVALNDTIDFASVRSSTSASNQGSIQAHGTWAANASKNFVATYLVE